MRFVLIFHYTQVTNEEVTHAELGGHIAHTTKSGVAHGAFNNDVDGLHKIRELLNYFPQSNKDAAPQRTTLDPIDRDVSSLATAVPLNPNTPYDVKEIIHKIVDENEFFEIQPDYAKNIVVGYASLNGKSVRISAPKCTVNRGVFVNNGVETASSMGCFPDAVYVTEGDRNVVRWNATVHYPCAINIVHDGTWWHRWAWSPTSPTLRLGSST